MCLAELSALLEHEEQDVQGFFKAKPRERPASVQPHL